MSALTLVGNPARIVPVAFGIAILVGAGLLMLPISSATGSWTPVVDALFTSTSAICVTGLTTLDTGTHWSALGQVIILILIQLGGLGIMVAATVIAVLFARRLGLRARLALQTETHALTSADIRRLVVRIVIFSLAAESVLAVVLGARLWSAYGLSAGDAAYTGVFHAISAFNNAGFSTYPDNLVSFAHDWAFLLPICIAVIVGGIGFPVVFELRRRWRRPRSWSILTRITVVMTLVLLALGTVFLWAEEGAAGGVLSGGTPSQGLLGAFTMSVMARTAGFNIVDMSELSAEALFSTDILMLIGGGSAGTAGGVKVTTVGLLAFVVWSEIRGRQDVEVGMRRVTSANQRQALSIAVLGMTAVIVSSFLLLAVTTVSFDAALFEVISAFATVGLSTGITPELPESGKVLLIVLMFVGRLGPLAVASAFALRERPVRRRYPEERMIIG